ncbi:MAG: hypothetical protein IPM27_12065 [Nitrosomonadales bacterium]|nr:hypothetical protein [Nitrosomonadales bacterium]
MREQSPERSQIQSFLGEMKAGAQAQDLAGGRLDPGLAATDKVLNTCLVYDDQGAQVARYDKIHLFDFEQHRTYRKRIPSSRAIRSSPSIPRSGVSGCQLALRPYDSEGCLR